MYNKYQQGGIIPPQQGGGLPPELQQILNSLPEDVKQYIMSLPIEQQIQELSRIAQGQMQAVQQSPNQMMQRGMNQESPMQQGPPMMKMGGKFQGGGNPRDYALDKPIGNVIPNYPYNTVETPNRIKPETKYQFKEGDKINLNGKLRDIVKTVINGKEFLGYIGDDGAFRPLNIGVTTPGTTAPQGGVNKGMYDFNPPAKISPVPTPVPPKRNNPVPKPNYPNKPGNTVSPPNSSNPGPRSYDPNSDAGTAPQQPKQEFPGPNYIPGLSPVMPIKGGGSGLPKNGTRPGIGSNLSPTPNWGLPNNKSNDKSNKTLPNNSSQLQGPDKGYTTHEGYQSGKKQNNVAQQKLTEEYNNLMAKAKNGTITELELNRLRHMQATGVKVGSTIPSYNIANYPQRGQLQHQYIIKRQYGGTLYASGGPQYVDPDELPYGSYRKENRLSARDVRQAQRNQKRLNKLKEKELRLNDEKARWRMNQARQSRVQGRYNINTHGADNHAANRDYFEDQIEQKSGLSMPNAQAPQRTSPNRQPIVPSPPAVITPVPKPNVNPSPNVTPTPNNGGKKGLSDFEKAFAAARKAQGPGGRFWWNGREFTTDYKEEVGKGKGGSGSGTTTPTNPNTPATPATGGQPAVSKWRKGIGEIGGDVAKILEKLDLGYWTKAAAKKAGLSDTTANALGFAGSAAGMFLPFGALGVASKVYKGGKALQTVAKAAKIANTVDKVADTAKAAKTAKQLVTYGPKAGEFLANAPGRVGNVLKYAAQATKIAPGGAELGRAGVAYGKGTEEGDAEALRRGLLGAGMTYFGARSMGSGIKSLNSTRAAQQELGEYANIAGKGLHKRVLNSKTGEQMWQKVKPGSVGDDILNSAKKQGVPNPRFQQYDTPGTYMDDLGNMYDKSGKLLKSAKDSAGKVLDRGIKTVDEGLEGAKNIGGKVVDKTKKLVGKDGDKVIESVDDILTKSGATFKDGAWNYDGKIYSIEEAKILAQKMRDAMAKKQYGGQIYRTGGKISKNKGMRITTCKYGCH